MNMNLVEVFFAFQSPEFWNEIKKCESEEEREEAIKQIRNNAKASLEKFVLTTIIIFSVITLKHMF